MWEVAQGVQGGSEGGHRETQFWMVRNNKNVNRVRKVSRSNRRLGILQIEFAPQGGTVNIAFLMEVLRD